MGRFADAVAGLRADLDKGVMSSEHAMRSGYKAAGADAALGRGLQALTEWIRRPSGNALLGASALPRRQCVL